MLAPAPMPAPGMPAQPTVAPKFHDVTVVTKRDRKRARVMPVPPEEFGISRHARTIQTSGYCFHEVVKRQEELIDEGFDETQIDGLPSYIAVENTEQISRDTVEEGSAAGGDNGQNRNNRQIKITEHYVRMDYDGKPGLYRVTTGGESCEILKRDGKEDIILEEFMPFAAITPVPVPHRFFGRSVADLVMDIQRIKTALLRAILDNAYLAVNPRVEVSESHASDNTLDDLLVSRPGGIVRTKQPGGLNWQVVPSVAAETFQVVQYFDNVREWRTGVSRAGQGLDPNTLQNQSATAANQLFTAAQARMKLIARIFAETGIRDLFSLLHAVIRKNGSKAQTVRLRNQWVQVDPREWKQRDDMTINVGLGTGSKAEQLAKFMSVVGAQKELIAAGKTHMVPDDKLYNSAKELAKLAGQPNPDAFFTDPKTVEPPQPQPDPKLVELQMKNEIEKTQAQADIVSNTKKIDAEIARDERRAALEMQMKREEHAMKMEEHRAAMAREMAKAITAPKEKDAEGNPVSHPADHLAPMFAEILDHLRKASAPKRVIRDERGKVSHVEPM